MSKQDLSQATMDEVVNDTTWSPKILPRYARRKSRTYIHCRMVPKWTFALDSKSKKKMYIHCRMVPKWTFTVDSKSKSNESGWIAPYWRAYSYIYNTGRTLHLSHSNRPLPHDLHQGVYLKFEQLEPGFNAIWTRIRRYVVKSRITKLFNVLI